MLRTAYLFAVYPLVLTTLLKGRHVSATVVNPTIVESRNVTGLKVYSDENADLACIASNGEWGQNQVVDPRTKKNWESWPRDRLIVDWSAWAEGLGKAGKGSKSWSVRKYS